MNETGSVRLTVELHLLVTAVEHGGDGPHAVVAVGRLLVCRLVHVARPLAVLGRKLVVGLHDNMAASGASYIE